MQSGWIKDVRKGIAEAGDTGKPTLCRIMAAREAALDGVRKAQGTDEVRRPAPGSAWPKVRMPGSRDFR